jgi:simple sugar transport system ATP-binding protein
MSDNGLALEMRGISKTYHGGKKANNNITLDLRKAEILCIAGENGAGKTTLMKILCGQERPDSGKIFIDGAEVRIDSPAAANTYKIGMVHQHFTLFDDYTVAENIVMGNEPRKWGLFFDNKKAVQIADAIVKENNFSVHSNVKIKDISQGEKQQVEICRVLYRNAQIIILDEPSSILTEYETRSLFSTLRRLASSGISIILITHKLREIKQICSRVAVMRKGELAGVFDNERVDENEIARLILGNENITQFGSIDISPNYAVQNTAKHLSTEIKPVIAFENVTVMRKGQKRPLLDSLSFSVNSGAIMGFTGVGGNGLGVLEAVLGGFLHPSSGTIKHGEKDITYHSIRRLRNQGMAYVPSDRIHVGSSQDALVTENMIINRRDSFSRGIYFDAKKINEYTNNLIKRYNIESAQSVAAVSGGNLQKLILAREIDWFSDYIIFCEPSWGLDIAASRYVTDEILKLRDRGAAIILISTNIDEVLLLANTVTVMYRGKAAGVFANNHDAALKDAIGAYMLGGIQ